MLRWNSHFGKICCPHEPWKVSRSKTVEGMLCHDMIWDARHPSQDTYSLVTEQDDSQQFFENQGFLWTFICHWHPGYERATPKIWWWFQHVDHEKQSNHMGDAIRNRRVNIKELKTSAHLYRNLTYDLWRVFQDMQNSCNRSVNGTIIG